MLNTENDDEQTTNGKLQIPQPTDEPAALLQQLVRLQNALEEQGHRVALALQGIANAVEKGVNVSMWMICHLKAQIYLTHMHLDDLERLLDAID